MNAVRNGTRIARYRLILGELPAKFERIKKYSRSYRRDLEAAVEQVHGEVGIIHAHHIDLAVSCETHAMLCKWIINHKHEDLSTQDLLACSREIPKAKETRNKAIERLGLQRDASQNIFDSLYAPEPSDASDAATEDETGSSA